MTQEKVYTHNITHLAVETNSFGAWFAQHCRQLMPKLEVFGLKAKKEKMGRIIANAGLIKHHFYFPEVPNESVKKFMEQMCQLVVTSKDKDDAADSITGMAGYLEHYYQMFRE
jgi:hypothetical protein